MFRIEKDKKISTESCRIKKILFNLQINCLQSEKLKIKSLIPYLLSKLFIKFYYFIRFIVNNIDCEL